MDDKTPQIDVRLRFEEIGVALDDNQYRDVISLVDMYHFYLRQRQVSLHVGATPQLTQASSIVNFDQVTKNMRETLQEPVCDSLAQLF